MSATAPHEVATGFRLSPPQQRLWRLRQAWPGVEFGAQGRVWLRGALELARLNAAVARVRARHEILRARFALLAGTTVPVQVADTTARGLDASLDLRRHGGAAGELELAAQAEWARLSDALVAPAVTIVLARLADQEHALLITVSGLCGDALAVVNVAREIGSEYEHPGTLDGETLQYVDLSEWQNRLLEEPGPEDLSPYWAAPGYADLAFPSLPFERLRAAGARMRLETLTRELSPRTWQTWQASDAASRRAALLSAWAIVLQRLSRTERFLLGVLLDGRPEPELRVAVGPLARTLPLALSVPTASTFAALTEQVRAALESAEHDQLVFGWGAFGLPDPSVRRHLFPLVFGLRDEPSLDVAGALTWELGAIVERLEPCDLAASVVTVGANARLELTWDASLYERQDVELTAQRYVALLDEIAAQAAPSVGAFRLWGCVDEAPATSPHHDEPAFHPVREQIEAQARRAPESPAVVCGDDTLTYGELDRRATRLARRLRKAGAARESVVALVAERSVEFFVGLLAVLKAGAAWLPIEPETPAARVRDMLAQAGVSVALTQSGLELPALVADGLATIALGAWAGAESEEDGAALAPVHPRDLAYVIFTSGSTGRPKGVAVEQAELAAYVRGFAARVDLRASRSFALVSTVAADLGHTSVFSALTTGGCLHVIAPHLTSDADALAEYFLARPVDFIKIVPAHLQAICASLPDHVRLPWRCVVAGGERLSWELVETVRRVAPAARVLNHYGPTETTVGVLCTPAERAAEGYGSADVPLGRPLDGATIWLLDEELRPVPPWLPGELYVGGACVARGYVGRGDLTAERFVPDPFSKHGGERLYRTGDLARRRGDGTIEFLGRRDGQVKVRGYRVELGEIEAALARHPDVSRAVVLAADGEPGGARLIAWAAVGEARLSPDELRRFLEASLPRFMVPGTIVCVPRLELTPNGKVDRQALPSPPTATGTAPAEPADEVERDLLTVWRHVLGQEHVGVDDNYFALGGDSLRVVQLVHEARRLGLVLVAADVLRHQTVRRLRRAMQEQRRHAVFPKGVPALDTPPRERLPHLPADVEDAYPVSGIQHFILAEYARGRPGRGVYHIQECLHLRDPGFSLEALEQAFRAVVRRHPTLRTVFDLESDPPLQWVRREPRFTLRVDDLSALAPAQQEARIEAALDADRECRFDPGDRETPLFRVAAFLRSPSDCAFVLSCHHALLDGWGHRVMTNQLFQAYAALKAGRAPDLGQPDRTYREFVAFQEAVRCAPRAASFWRRRLDGIATPALVPTPASHAEPDEPMVLCPLGSDLTAGLRALARRRLVSLQAIFLSAWLAALREWTGHELVVSGVLVNGRSELLSDPLTAVGLFWNIVPVVSQRAAPLPELAAAVQRDLIESEPYVAYPWPQILADQGGRVSPFSSFRYLHFWNEVEPSESSGVQILDVTACDRYSFPLDGTAFLRSGGEDGYLILQYDPAVLARPRVQDLLQRYESVLRDALAADSASAD